MEVNGGFSVKVSVLLGIKLPIIACIFLYFRAQLFKANNVVS